MTTSSKRKILETKRCTCKVKKTLRVKPKTCSRRKRIVCERGFDVVNETAGDIALVTRESLRDFDFADTVLANEAVRIIGAHDSASPLFLFLSWAAPHSPTQSPKRFQALNNKLKAAAGGNMAALERLQYAGMVSALDDAHAKVQDALTLAGLWNDTLFIFMSDNGGASSKRTGRNYPLRGGKFTFWEGGARTLGFVYSPRAEIVPEGRRGTKWERLISIVDWPATILGALDLSTPADFAPDSVNVWPAIVDDTVDSPRTEIPMQIFKEANRYVFLFWDSVERRLLKYIHGYAGKINKYGYLTKNRFITRRSRGDAIVLPEELEPSDDYYDAAVVKAARNVKLWHKCVDSPCLFDVTADPSEIHNLWANTDAVPESTREAFLARLEVHSLQEVPFVGSGLCFPDGPDSKGLQSLLRSKSYFDTHSIAMVRLCGAYVPWYLDTGVKAQRVMSSCPTFA